MDLSGKELWKLSNKWLVKKGLVEKTPVFPTAEPASAIVN
jgi:hypothetical protein